MKKVGPSEGDDPSPLSTYRSVGVQKDTVQVGAVRGGAGNLSGSVSTM